MAYPNLSPGARLQAVKLKDADGNPIGEVREWMMDIDEGRVVYVLATTGQQSDNGATEYAAIPWQLMQADKENGGYRVKASQEQWTQGPRVSSEQINDLVTNTGFLDQLYQHYGLQAGGETGRQPESAEQSAPAYGDGAAFTPETQQPSAGNAQPHPNDLKERRDDQAGNTGDQQGGMTNEEHGIGSGYGGGQPVE